MRFRRKSEPTDAPGPDDPSAAEDAGDAGDAGSVENAGAAGPHDSGDVHDANGRVDLGSLLLAPVEGQELRIQVDDASGQVQSVLLAGEDGALDLRAFAASRGDDLWADVRPRIAADLAQQGALASEREGPFGTELITQIAAGQGQAQVTRIIGVNGPRWLLRATLYGRPAVEPDAAQVWEQSIRSVIVHRGSHAVPPGEALPVTLPAQARRLE